MALDKELLLEVSELNAFVVADKVEPVVAFSIATTKVWTSLMHL